MPRRGGTRFSSPSGASTRNAILCASGLIVLFSSGQDRGGLPLGEKKDTGEMEHSSPSIPSRGLLCRAEGPEHDGRQRAGVGFLWDCRNDAGMLYEGLTSALRPGQ